MVDARAARGGQHERLPLIVFILLLLLLMLVGIACVCATDDPMQAAERPISSISAVLASL
jgi:hypothetical protein